MFNRNGGEKVMDFQIFFLKENTRIYDRAELMTFLSSNPNITPPNLKENTSKKEYIYYHQTLNFEAKLYNFSYDSQDK